MKDVFLSHAATDKNEIVLPFVAELEKRRISYWLDEAEIKWGDKIASSINDGLSASRYVVVFLTTAFFGRNWTETELSAALSRENSEGRTVVLPVLAGDPAQILASHPILKDKAYVRWDEGIETIVDHLERELFEILPRGEVKVRVGNTGNTTSVSPTPLIDFLRGLDGWGIFSPHFVCDELRKCGFLADVQFGRGIVVNGYSIPETRAEYGIAGTRGLHLARLVFQLLTGNVAPRRRIGRGSAYRALTGHLISALRESERARTQPVPPLRLRIGRPFDDSDNTFLYWEPSAGAEYYVLLAGNESDPSEMVELSSTKEIAFFVHEEIGRGRFFGVKAADRYGVSEMSNIVRWGEWSDPDPLVPESTLRTVKLTDDLRVYHEEMHRDGWEDLGWDFASQDSECDPGGPLSTK